MSERPLALAELHVHLEGTATQQMLRLLAARRNVPAHHPVFTRGPAKAWSDFSSFLAAYDAAAAVFRAPEDYEGVARDYLETLARSGALYAELTLAPQLAADNRVGLLDLLRAVENSIRDARETHGIEARILVTAIRHRPVYEAEQLARDLERNQSELVTGFGLAGDERVAASCFEQAIAIARTAGLGISVHAGEIGGPESVWDALSLPIDRIGHGVRAIEDPRLVEELAARRITLECCPGSNVDLGVCRDMSSHPAGALHNAGVRVTLNSDDPAFFSTSLAHEYQAARHAFQWTTADLHRITATAIQAAFLDEPTRSRLLAELGSIVEDDNP
jgi:adenosine deaminase